MIMIFTYKAKSITCFSHGFFLVISILAISSSGSCKNYKKRHIISGVQTAGQAAVGCCDTLLVPQEHSPAGPPGPRPTAWAPHPQQKAARARGPSRAAGRALAPGHRAGPVLTVATSAFLLRARMAYSAPAPSLAGPFSSAQSLRREGKLSKRRPRSLPGVPGGLSACRAPLRAGPAHSPLPAHGQPWPAESPAGRGRAGPGRRPPHKGRQRRATGGRTGPTGSPRHAAARRPLPARAAAHSPPRQPSPAGSGWSAGAGPVTQGGTRAGSAGRLLPHGAAAPVPARGAGRARRDI